LNEGLIIATANINLVTRKKVSTTVSKFTYVEGDWRAKEKARRRLLLSFF